MEILASVIIEKDKRNWLKSWLALDIAKSGLEQFAEKEAQIVHDDIVKSMPATKEAFRREIKQKHRDPKKIAWKNSKDDLWSSLSSSHPWEVARLYLSHGYEAELLTSAQTTDFAGIISFMQNCLNFDNKFSFFLDKKKTCYLTEANKMRIALCHPAALTDLDENLQKYFTTLIKLLSDSTCLGEDNEAKSAVLKLVELQNKRTSLNELAELLKRGNQTLKDAKKAGKSFPEGVEEALEKALKMIEDKTQEGEERIEGKTQEGEERIEGKTQEGEERIEGKTQEGEKRIEGKTQEGEERIEGKTQEGEERIEGKTQEGVSCLESKAQEDVERIESKTQELKSKIQAVDKIEQGIYERDKTDMLRKLTTHYKNTLSQVSTSPFHDWVQERLADIYMPPNLQLMKKDKGSFMKTNDQITEYKHMCCKDSKLNQHMFIQGEAGAGKSTFLSKLVMDWCSINTTQFVETFPMDETNNADNDSRTNFFKDLETLKCYQFIFHVTLRDSDQQFEIFEIIKNQIIDTIYGKYDRETAYKLLNEIMKRERCLLLLDGLDEWTSPGGHYIPVLVESYSQCDVLITTRPWKMTLSKIPDSKIDTLLQLEGVNEPFDVSKRLLACKGDYKESEDLDNKQSEFESYVEENNLYELLVSPMLLSLIVQSWTEGTELKGSRCEIYSLLLESLIKKANSETSEFEQPPFPCFRATQYIQPNIEHLNRLSEAAFYLLFSDTQEKALVFTRTELKKFNLGQLDANNFALKSGILSATRNASVLRSSSSFSFMHKSIQEFLAALHIAHNPNLIDDVISGYLNSHEYAYLEISQVFIFLCGLDMSAANKLSGMMNEHNGYTAHWLNTTFQDIILAGNREAVANQQNGVLLKLSNYYFRKDKDIRDLHSIWSNNKSNVLSLNIHLKELNIYQDDRQSSPASGESASHIEFDLSLCTKLQLLSLSGNDILLKGGQHEFHVSSGGSGGGGPPCVDATAPGGRGAQASGDDDSQEEEAPLQQDHALKEEDQSGESASSATAKFPVWIELKSAEPSQCILPSIKHIHLEDVTCSSAWLRSLFSLLLTLDHEVTCELPGIFMEGAETRAIIHKDLNNSLSVNIWLDSTYLLKALHGLNIKTLNLSGPLKGLSADQVESLSQSLSSLTQLETLSIYVWGDSPGLWKVLHGLNIKSLNLSGEDGGWRADDVESLLQSLSSLTQLEMLSINVRFDSPGLWKVLHGLNIKSLNLSGLWTGLNADQVESWSQSLASLTQLETLSISLLYDSPGLWKALHGLNIKTLNLRSENGGLSADDVESLSQSLSLLPQLETVSINVWYDSPGLWKALHGLNIKTLNLSGRWQDLNADQVESWSQSLASLTQLETLSISLWYDSPGLWKALHGLNIKTLNLSGEDGGWRAIDVESLLQSLSSLTQLETLSINVWYDSPGLWKALHGLNIKQCFFSVLGERGRVP